ncbi:MAG TPA: thioredoxin domain-containing protein [Bacillales bacterium]|nr:thioredoxin domain-containing protein [Bacillales bacterium]
MNHLANEKSPYLLQHAHNPVDWYPWGKEAFEKAKAENKPVLVSIGYSTCHWCHVMAHETFEDPEIAEMLNDRFVSIKVDREERPDVDAIYMKVCQAMTGQGGWPLNVFVTPDQKPFYAGTYFPKESRFGHPGFVEVITQLYKQYKETPEKITNIGNQVTEAFQKHRREKQTIDPEILHKCHRQLEEAFDPEYGGFGQEPKFPSPHQLTYLLRYHRWTGETQALEMVTKTLDSMADGGIYDHIGFGFSRYSVDERWLVPHFEKMLYDQAMLAIAYTEAYQVTKIDRYRTVSEEILSYVTREMRDTEGGFYSAEDADSEGEEGKFYLWTKDEILDVLDRDGGEHFCKVYDITEEGNFEGKNIPYLIENVLSEEERKSLERARQQLFKAREKRVHPHKDDKILTSWNGLMAVAFAKAGQVFDDDGYIQIAEEAVIFIEETLAENGRLMARYRDGEVKHKGFIDDYANLLWAYIELYETRLDVDFLKRAVDLAHEMIDLFWDAEKGGFYFYGNDSESLITRPKELYDAAVPSGNSVAALQLLRLSKLTGQTAFENKVSEMFEVFSDEASYYPSGFTYFLQSLLVTQMSGKEVVVLGDKDDQNYRRLIGTLQQEFLPEVTFLGTDNVNELAHAASFTSGFAAQDETTVYVCENFSCQRPTTNVEDVIKQLNR